MSSSDRWAALVVDCLATYRLTRLVTADVISEPARVAVLRRVGSAIPERSDRSAQEHVEALPDPPKLATLVTCRWCAGIWVAAGIAGARVLAPRVWDPVARGLAASAAAVLLARFET